ncbi:hypothetical protein C8R43DRAFT_1129632 [Mycena crocata]|nr:hypothetical protein C8R43DRAFT_1129632 [Mycena crocata]
MSDPPDHPAQTSTPKRSRDDPADAKSDTPKSLMSAADANFRLNQRPGDLQQGETFMNFDHRSLLPCNESGFLHISYDICCQWPTRHRDAALHACERANEAEDGDFDDLPDLLPVNDSDNEENS